MSPSLLLTTLLTALPVQDASPLHPVEAVLYAEVPGAETLRVAFQETAYWALLSDPELQASLGRMFGVETLDPRAWLETQLLMQEENGELPPLTQLVQGFNGASLSLQVRDGDLGSLYQALAEGSGPQAVLADIGLAVVLDYTTDAHAEHALDLILALLDSSSDSTLADRVERNGIRVHRWRPTRDGEVQPGMAMFRQGRRIGFHAGGIGQDALANGLAGDAEGLPAGRRFQAGRQRFSDGEGTTILEVHSQLGGLLPALVGEPWLPLVLDLADGLLGPGFTLLARGGDWRIQVQGDRFVTEGFHPDPGGSPLDKVLSRGALDQEALALVDPSAAVGWIVSLDGDRLAAYLQSEYGSSGQDPMADFEAKYGFRLDRDLVEPLGPALVWSLNGNLSLLSAPPISAAVAVDDPVAFARGAAGLANMLRAEYPNQVSLSKRTYRGYDIHTLSLHIPGFEVDFAELDLMALLKPSIVVLDDRALITLNPTQAKRQIKRALRGELGVHEMLSGDLLPTGGAGEIGFADWMGVLGSLYDGGKSFLPMIQAAGDVLPFDATELPASEVITRHFKPSHRWKRRTPSGVLHHVESSFGPEAPLALAIGLIGAAYDAGEIVLDAPANESPSDEAGHR